MIILSLILHRYILSIPRKSIVYMILLLGALRKEHGVMDMHINAKVNSCDTLADEEPPTSSNDKTNLIV